MKIFTENKAGVHLMDPIQGEYSLCGDAFDIDSEADVDEHDGRLKPTDKKVVTCKRCKAVIMMCRGVRIS